MQQVDAIMFLLWPRRTGPLLASLFALIMLGVPLVQAEGINSADVINFVEEAFAADRVPGGAVAIIVDGEVDLSAASATTQKDDQ